MGRVLILGGGFGGVAAAHRLRGLLGADDEVVLVDRGTHFMMGFRKNAEVAGRGTMEAGRRPLAALERHGIRVVRGTVTRIDPAGRAAEIDGGTLQADALVVALGAALDAEAVPGLGDHGLNVYDPAQVPQAARAVADRRDGRVVIGIFGAPYMCPPAPYELALLLEDAARARGTGPTVTVFTPQPMSLPVLGAAGCDVLEGELGSRGIDFRANAKATAVEPGRVVLAGGEQLPFDLLLAVPPHRCPALLVEAGLAEPGAWVRPDPGTLRTPFEGVWAIGDCTQLPLATGQPLPKAGVLAEAEGVVVAERVAASLAGREPEAVFDGQGACFLEVGGGEARMVRGRFLATPAPDVELTEASPRYLEEKARYERERLDTWFGGAERTSGRSPDGTR
jgi:sulfide:quinone oxidoreductase